MELDTIWQTVLGEIEVTHSKGIFNTWFKSTYLIDCQDDYFVIGVDAVANFSHVVALVDADGDPATPGLRLPTLAEIAAGLAAAKADRAELLRRRGQV